MSPSLDGTRPEYMISQEDNSPLTLYIDFSNFQIFLDINSSFDPVHSEMHAHSSQPYKYLIKEEGIYIFMKSEI